MSTREIAVLAEDDVLREVLTVVLTRAGFAVSDAATASAAATVVVHAAADGVRIGRHCGGPARLVPAPLWEHVLVAAVGAAHAAWHDDGADALAAK